MNNLKAKVICAGNCPVCNKPLKDGECIFMCNECKIKNEKLMELENLKAEIMATGNWKSEYEISDRGVIKAVEIIDNHISELKGESK